MRPRRGFEFDRIIEFAGAALQENARSIGDESGGSGRSEK